jgi:hypothetical protein
MRVNSSPEYWILGGIQGETFTQILGDKSSPEVADTECLNLAEPSLLDLLSDEPVPGVVARGSSSPPLNHLPASSGGSMSKKLLRAQQFKF